MTIIIPEWFAWFLLAYLAVRIPLTLWETRIIHKQIALKKQELKMLEERS